MSDSDSELLGGRYRLRNQIARGGMTDVFLGQDTLLSRPVAIKRLFPEFAADPSFVERFRREATAAANLNHPNIVAVYDWGSDKGTYFIVMEYIEGQSLAELLRSGGRLPPERSAEIAMYVAAALGFAHTNGVIHRDVKPGNVLLSPDGKVKVTDFGIAIAAFGGAESNLTQTGSVMGTATYFSPEQAQGKTLDHRSDLYSLGIVLYEMLCGRPPFTGDSSVAVAYKHVQQAVPSPSSLGIVLPESLEAITKKLLAKNPAQRYPTANDVQRDLRRFREGRHQLSPRQKAAEAQSEASPPSAKEPERSAPPPAAGGPPQPPATPQPAPVAPQPAPATVLEPSSRAGLYTAAAVIFIAVAVLVFFVLSNVLENGDDVAPPAVTITPAPLVSVPDVAGLSSQAAIRELRAAGFVVSQVFEASETVESNEVISQSPAARTEVEQGEEIEITVSSGTVPVAVPGVVGQNANDAARFLQDRGFASELIVELGSTAPAGQVLRQDPAAGSEVAPGSTVVLFVAEGIQAIEVPGVMGMTLLQATQILAQAGLEVSDEVLKEPSDEVEKDLVISTNPAPPVLLLPGTSITILVSSGPESVVVPSLIGLTSDTAADRLAELELVLIQPIAECDFPNDTEELIGRIMEQVPLAEEEHPPGTEVTACLGRPTSAIPPLETPEPFETPGPVPTSGPSDPVDAPTPRRTAARNAAAEVNTRSIAAANQPDALGSIAKWNALSSRFDSECRSLARAYSDIPGFAVEWNLEPPYPMPAAAANAANWAEGIDGDTPGVDNGCTVSWS